MTSTPVESTKHRVITAVSWIAAGLLLLAASLAEAAPGPEVRGDGDNPADSLRYLAEAGRAYLWSGALLGVGGAALITGAVGRLRARGGHPASMLLHVMLVLTIVAGTLIIGAGAIRMQATGTVPHIESLDTAWGEAAYLAVQMAGTQGMLSAGVFTMLVVTVALSIAEWRNGMRAPLFVAALPAIALIVLLSDLFVPGFDSALPEFVFPVYFVSALLGIPMWCAAYGVSQLVVGRAASRRGVLAS